MVLPVIGLIAGCSTTAETIPSEITLESAIRQVKDGIELLQQKKDGSKPAGLLISEVNVSFNITASTTDKKSIGLDLAPGNVIKEIPTGKFESSSEKTLSRGNVISFKFQNLLLANKDTLVGVSVTPVTMTTEKTITKDKDTTIEKTPELRRLMTLEELIDLLDKKMIIMSPPVNQ